MGKETFTAFDAAQWDRYRASGNGKTEGGYDNLGWVKDNGLLGAILDDVQPTGTEKVVDAGAGSGVVYRQIASHVDSVYAFDISKEMIRLGQANKPDNVTLEHGDIYRILLPDGSHDVAIARMVFHHLSDVPAAVRELVRVVKPGGKVVVVEYVAKDAHVQQFERQVFDIKERGRHLWTPDDLMCLLVQTVSEECSVEMEFATLCQYSVRDWMGKSGLTREKQDEIFQLYYRLSDYDPLDISGRLGITFRPRLNGFQEDILVDRLFAHAVISKGQP